MNYFQVSRSNLFFFWWVGRERKYLQSLWSEQVRAGEREMREGSKEWKWKPLKQFWRQQRQKEEQESVKILEEFKRNKKCCCREREREREGCEWKEEKRKLRRSGESENKSLVKVNHDMVLWNGMEMKMKMKNENIIVIVKCCW